MSIKKTGARLWFETQAEIDDYDDLMISNIELKSEDYDDPNFTIVASRTKKEILPGNHNSLFNRTVAKIEAFSLGKTHLRLGEIGGLGTRSLLINEKYYLYKAWGCWILSYFFLRELPIKNFYARSLIMVWFLFKYKDTYGLPNFDTLISKPQGMVIQSHYKKERRIFHWFQQTDRAFKVTEHGINYIYILIIIKRNYILSIDIKI